MRIAKTSHHIFILILAVIVISAVAYSLFISKNLKKKPNPVTPVWLLGKGSYFKDTLLQTYQHLVTDFPLIELHSREENSIEIEGYENSRRFLTIKNSNDTLYVNQAFPDSDTILVAIEGDYPIVVRVGAQALKSITVKNKGRIDIPVNPYGANPGAEIVYKPEDWEKYVLRNNALDLHLEGNGKAELFIEIKTLNVVVNNNRMNHIQNYSCSSLIGKVNKFKLIDPHGDVCINAFYLQSDTLVVLSDPSPNAFDVGFISIECKEYLKANLLYKMDVSYHGIPEIVKNERGFGRVINNNSKN